VRHALAPLTDEAFDRLIPEDLRHLSNAHWTPLSVAVRAASLLCPSGDARVLDLGCGIGKLCTVGALSRAGMWCGVEQHGSLVDGARELAHRLGVTSRTRFVHADAFSIDWSSYDALYLYNPFELALFEPDARQLTHAEAVARVEARLLELRIGVRIVTLNGFGGVMPAGFRLVYHEHIAPIGLDLVLWVQQGRRARTWMS